jgi:hypothetical protein
MCSSQPKRSLELGLEGDAFGTLRSFVLTVRFCLLRNSAGQHLGKRRLARAGCGARAGRSALWRRLLCASRSGGPGAELATRPAAAALKQLRRVSFGGALRARAASPAMLDALYARRSRPLPARAGDG